MASGHGEGLEAYRKMRWSQKDADILREASRLFSEKGFGSVGMAEIARHADVSTATLYKHFGSKDDLFGACIEQQVEAGEDEQDYLAAVARKELSAIDIPKGRARALKALEKYTAG